MEASNFFHANVAFCLTFWLGCLILSQKISKDLTKVDLLLVRSATDAHDIAGRRPDLPLRSVPNICPRQATCAAPLPTMSACPFPAPLSQAAATWSPVAGPSAEEKAAAERREKGIKLLGRRGVLQQHWNSRPGTREPRRGLSPRVACKNTWARVEALQRNQAFIDRYREARADHLAGREEIFPAGTWWLHRFAGVKCAELGATAPPSWATTLLRFFRGASPGPTSALDAPT